MIKQALAACLVIASVVPGAVVWADLYIPANTEVPISFNTTATSRDLKPGSKLAVKIAQDVLVGDVLVFKAGTDGLAEVKKNRKSGAMGSGGQINIERATLPDTEGKPHEVRIKFETKGKDNAVAGFGTGLFAASLFTLPIALLFAASSGKDAQIPTGVVLSSYTLQSYGESPEVVAKTAETKPDELKDLISRLGEQ